MRFPGVLICGALIGAANGLGITVLGLPPIVMTLAANGILQGLALALTGGSPTGFAPPGLRWLVTGAFAGLTPVVWLFPLFIIAGVVLQRSTYLGRMIYAIGNSPKVARLSGVDVRATVITAYTISGFCAALSAFCSSASTAPPTSGWATNICCRPSRSSWPAACSSPAAVAIISA